MKTGAFARYWAAAAISSFGTAVTAVAMPVLVVQVLGASPLQVGLVSAAQFLPYGLLGLFAGVYVDRWRRKQTLIWASVGRALSLGAIVVLWLTGVLQIWMLVLALLAFGSFSVFGFVATQSLLPRLVPREDLVTANARLDQTDAAAQTLGPTLGGGLVGLLGAPIAIAVDAVSYLIESVLVAGVKVTDPRASAPRRKLWTEIGEGLRFAYRHPTLTPLAVSTHMWFLANGAALTVLSLLALRTLGLSPFAFGLLFTAFGLASLVGASLAPAVGRRLGSGRAVIFSRWAYPLSWLLVLVAPTTPIAPPLLFTGLAVQGLAAGVENAHEMGFWQRETPDELLGRTNAFRRSANRTLAAVGALLAGVLAGAVGEAPVLAGVTVVFALAAVALSLSPLRHRSGASAE